MANVVIIAIARKLTIFSSSFFHKIIQYTLS